MSPAYFRRVTVSWVTAILWIFLLLTSCVSDNPFVPEERCPDVLIVISWSDTTMVTDSIVHDPDCKDNQLVVD